MATNFKYECLYGTFYKIFYEWVLLSATMALRELYLVTEIRFAPRVADTAPS